jgi:hypothetical protein
MWRQDDHDIYFGELQIGDGAPDASCRVGDLRALEFRKEQRRVRNDRARD